jgi:hypothetical protein
MTRMALVWFLDACFPEVTTEPLETIKASMPVIPPEGPRVPELTSGLKQHRRLKECDN